MAGVCWFEGMLEAGISSELAAAYFGVIGISEFGKGGRVLSPKT